MAARFLSAFLFINIFIIYLIQLQAKVVVTMASQVFFTLYDNFITFITYLENFYILLTNRIFKLFIIL